ncbi:2-methylbutanal oxime monooxygenase-like [Olea europaea var. sylvestris]|uniref:2-methylbutanal oxime monooxygenase-like n=1 Tax=Olea europaea var. sylvestris TaxID=158386 RepID=UPI000C1CFFC8|nr:2-methylbutanal oxime monooxygenase-like [Olea europaea var. sylvestris]
MTQASVAGHLFRGKEDFLQFLKHSPSLRLYFHLLNSRTKQSFAHEREFEVGKLTDYLSTALPNSVNLDEKMYDLYNGWRKFAPNFGAIWCNRACIGDALISVVAFSKSYRGKGFDGREVKDILDEAMDMANNSVTGHPVKVDKCFQKLDSYLQKVLDEHLHQEMRNGEDEDLVDVLIGMSKDPTVSGVYISKDHIQVLLMNTFLGGVDTCAITLVWAVSELVKNPRVMQKVQVEILGSVGMKPTMDSDDLKKTRVLITAWGIWRDPNSWKNLNEFFPGRFEDSKIDFKGQHFELLPFGAGRRLCPGISTSIVTVEFTLASLFVLVLQILFLNTEILLYFLGSCSVYIDMIIDLEIAEIFCNKE